METVETEAIGKGVRSRFRSPSRSSFRSPKAGTAARESRWRVRLLIGVAVIGAGCGDAQLDEQFRGASLWNEPIRAIVSAGSKLPSSSLRVALFYTPQGVSVVDPERWVEQPATSRSLQVPSDFVLSAFEVPQAALLIKDASGGSAQYGLARAVVYVDKNGSGLREPGEEFVGIVPDRAYLYAATDLAQGRTPTSAAMTAGFHPVVVPQICSKKVPIPNDPGDVWRADWWWLQCRQGLRKRRLLLKRNQATMACRLLRGSGCSWADLSAYCWSVHAASAVQHYAKCAGLWCLLAALQDRYRLPPLYRPRSWDLLL